MAATTGAGRGLKRAAIAAQERLVQVFPDLPFGFIMATPKLDFNAADVKKVLLKNLKWGQMTSEV